MAEQNAKNSPAPAASADPSPTRTYRAPAGVERTLAWPVGGGRKRVQAKADWLVLREHGVPVAEVSRSSANRRSVAWPQQGLFIGEPLAAPFSRLP